MQPDQLSMRGLITPAALARRFALVGGVLLFAILLGGGIQPPAVALHFHWPRLSLLAGAGLVVQLHVAGALVALIVGTMLLRRRKGTLWHKRLGWSWVAAMAAVVASSFMIRTSGHLSLIHAISGYVSVMLVLGIYTIRRGRVAQHRRIMTGVFMGGLIVAGLFTMVPGRLMYAVFFG